MQVPAIFTILTVALAAVAMPSTNVARGGPTVGPGGNAACGNGQVISCCNTKSVSSGSGGLLGLGGALDGVLGGSCSPLNVAVRKFPALRPDNLIYRTLTAYSRRSGPSWEGLWWQPGCLLHWWCQRKCPCIVMWIEYRINEPQGLVNAACTNVGVLWLALAFCYQVRTEGVRRGSMADLFRMKKNLYSIHSFQTLILRLMSNLQDI